MIGIRRRFPEPAACAYATAFAFAAASLLGAVSPAIADETIAQLRARDQALLDAIASGDRALWGRTLAPNAIYVDENGAIIRRAEYLQQLQPLPQGISGSIAITSYEAHITADVALVIHRDLEHEDYHGLPLRAQYLMTETWLKQAGEWHLALVHAYVVAPDPPAIALPEATLDEYVGRYRATKSLTYAIRRSGNTLNGGVEGRNPHPILAESRDLLFVPAQPRIRLLVQRDAAGRVTGFIDRREGEDIVWRRIAG